MAHLLVESIEAWRRRQQVLMAAVFALHAGKAVVEIAAVQIPVNDLLNIRTEKSI